MTPTTPDTNVESTLGQRLFIGAILLPIIILLGGWIFLSFSQWLALFFFFGSMLFLILYVFDKYDGRNLWLLVTAFIGILALATQAVRTYLLTNPQTLPSLQHSPPALNLTALLAGTTSAVVLIIPLLGLVFIAADSLLSWHGRDESISFADAFWHLLYDLLGVFYPTVIIEDGEITGTERDLSRMKFFGGPGQLTVFPGQVILLYKNSQTTRVVGYGSTTLTRDEKIQRILPLTPQGTHTVVDNILTQDKIPLRIKVAHAAQVESATETDNRRQQALDQIRPKLKQAQQTMQSATAQINELKKRLKTISDEAKKQELVETLENLNRERERYEQTANAAKKQIRSLKKEDKIVGDEYNQCYESVARLAATKAQPDISQAVTELVVSNLKDVLITCKFEALFSLNVNGNHEGNAAVDQRKIAEIEALVLERAGKAAPEHGLTLHLVDISEIHYPREIEQTVIAEATTVTKQRIKLLEVETNRTTALIEADTKEKTVRVEAKVREIETASINEAREMSAESEFTAAEYRSRAIKRLAQAKGLELGIMEHYKFKAKAEHYREVLDMLKASDYSEETVKEILTSVASNATLENDFKQFLDLLSQVVNGQNALPESPEPSADEPSST